VARMELDKLGELSWVYVGELRVRSTRTGPTYIHIPRKLVESLGVKRVVVRAHVIPQVDRCGGDKLVKLLPLTYTSIVFKATLTLSGFSYRAYIPVRYAKPLKEVQDCVTLNVYIAPEPGQEHLRGGSGGGQAPSQEPR
jgi:hypothetical protein